MPITRVLAGVVVADFDTARPWYERLLGSPARIPMEGEPVAEWDLAVGGLQVIGGTTRGGASMVTFVVADLEAQVADLAGRGFDLSAISGTPGAIRIATIKDPEGTLITFAENPDDAA